MIVLVECDERRAAILRQHPEYHVVWVAADKPKVPAEPKRVVPADQLLLTTVEASRLLSVSDRMVRRLIQSGELDSVTVYRCRRVPASSVRAYVERLAASIEEAA